MRYRLNAIHALRQRIRQLGHPAALLAQAVGFTAPAPHVAPAHGEGATFELDFRRLQAQRVQKVLPPFFLVLCSRQRRLLGLRLQRLPLRDDGLLGCEWR